MGIRVQVGTYTFEATDYSVEEQATPLAAGDSSGSVGSISFTIPEPDPDLAGTRDTGWKAVKTFGADYLLDLPVRLTDSRKGFTIGTVTASSRSDDLGSLSVTCQSRLGVLNVYGVQTQPYVGTLEGAVDYYLSLAGVETGFLVDETVAGRPVVFPGWTGELWYHLKEMTAAQDCDISLVSGVILVRPIRARVATRGRDTGRTREVPVPTLAQGVEVYLYNNRPISGEIVYPPGGWNPEVEVLNVNAGETAEYTLELSASVSSIEQPTMETWVEEEHDWSSVYTIVANDGLAISPSMWTSHGGSVTITINPDTTTLNVVLRGAQGIPTTSGGPATNFSLALASDTTGNRYSTLRILGSGVGFVKDKRYIRTSVPPSRTGTVVGVTIDNPFISTVDDLYRTGTRAAKKFAGVVPQLSGSVVAINQRGDSGQATYPPYEIVQDTLDAELDYPTYGEVQSFYTSEGYLTYEDVRQYWYTFVRDDFTNQVFGNAAGARIFDRKSRRWFRIRQATVTADRVSFQADDDFTHADMEEFHVFRTYGDVDLIMSGLTYKQSNLAGLYDGNN